MDKIIMNNMAFYGYHGVLEEENRLGQKFFVDAELYLELNKAGVTDDLNLTVSYADVYRMISGIVSNEKFCLLEALAETICSRILDTFKQIDKIIITIKKPEAPVNGIFDYFAVQIERKRQSS